MSINYANALKRYLNQSAMWKKCIGHDEYGVAIYEEAVEIKVRKIPTQTLITDSFQKQCVSETTVLALEEISVEDMIDDKCVMSVQWSVDRWGRNMARQVFI